MTSKEIVDLALAFAEPIALKYNYELIDVEYVKEGSSWYLRFFIEKEGGIHIDDCQVFSEEISKKLDETDPIKNVYHLEVSSPGLDRPLKNEKDYQRYKGENIEIHLYKPIDGEKVIIGTLIDLKGNDINIKNEAGTNVIIDREKTSIVKRYFKF